MLNTSRALNDCSKLPLTTVVWSREAVSLRPKHNPCSALAFKVPFGFICLCTMTAMANGVSAPNSRLPEASLQGPVGLAACTSDDSVAAVEKRLALQLGAQFVGCFKSQETINLRGGGAKHIVPVEYAIAMQILGGPYHPATLETLLSRVRDQWKNFKPLSKEHHEYVAQLNAMIQGVGSNADSTQIASISPVLISIDRISPEAYVVLSVRHYVSAGETGKIISTKVNGTAMVLHGTRLLQLEILRELHDPSDVDTVRHEIQAWVEEIAADAGNNPRSQ